MRIRMQPSGTTDFHHGRRGEGNGYLFRTEHSLINRLNSLIKGGRSSTFFRACLVAAVQEYLDKVESEEIQMLTLPRTRAPK